MGETTTPETKPGPWIRNPTFDEQFLDQVARQAGLHGRHIPQLKRRVLARLDKGAISYGAFSYLSSDNLAEALEEPEDILGWCLLECYRIYLDVDRGMDAGDASMLQAELIQACSEAVGPWLRIQSVMGVVREFRASRSG